MIHVCTTFYLPVRGKEKISIIMRLLVLTFAYTGVTFVRQIQVSFLTWQIWWIWKSTRKSITHFFCDTLGSPHVGPRLTLHFRILVSPTRGQTAMPPAVEAWSPDLLDHHGSPLPAFFTCVVLTARISRHLSYLFTHPPLPLDGGFTDGGTTNYSSPFPVLNWGPGMLSGHITWLSQGK